VELKNQDDFDANNCACRSVMEFVGLLVVDYYLCGSIKIFAWWYVECNLACTILEICWMTVIFQRFALLGDI
jgi:hypothetical protein